MIGFWISADAQMFSEKQQEIIDSGQGIVINGIIWATGNVQNGEFVKPNEPGIRPDWERAQKACPKGWRLPTYEELEELINAGSEWTTTPINGCFFGSGNNRIFLPAAGARLPYKNRVNDMGKRGYYWCSTVSRDSDFCLLFGDKFSRVARNTRGYGFSVRCVAE